MSIKKNRIAAARRRKQAANVAAKTFAAKRAAVERQSNLAVLEVAERLGLTPAEVRRRAQALAISHASA